MNNTKRTDRPYIHNHQDGTVHWLTGTERASVSLGTTNAEKLKAKHRPDLAQ